MTVVRRTRTRVQAPATPRSEGVALRRQRAKDDKQNRADAPKDLSMPVVALIASDGDPFTKAVDKANYRIQPTREGDYLHVSDLLSKCLRVRALNRVMGIKPPTRRLTLSDMLTFAQGDAIHDEMKDIARRGDPGQVWGKWSCKCESLMHEEPCTFDEIDQEEVCPHCHTHVTRYHEVSMFNDEHWIVGNPDMIQFIRAIKAYHITELKSMAHEKWKELARPLPEHVLQVVFYWWLMREKGYRLTNKCTIFYVTKTWQFGNTSPHKSFLIDVQSELHRLDEMLEDAKAHKRSIQSIIASEQSKSKKLPVVLPPRIHCADKGTKDAKSCAVCDICFEMA